MTSIDAVGHLPVNGVVITPPSRRHRVLARIRAAQLDPQLARGCSPDDGGPLAARAAQLVAPRNRARLAGHWEDLLARADRPRLPTDPRVPLPRRRIHAAAPVIRDLVACLRRAAPVPVRGVAMAQQLLTDGAGPLYGRGNGVALDEAIAAVVRHLDPTTLLLDRDRGA